MDAVMLDGLRAKVGPGNLNKTQPTATFGFGRLLAACRKCGWHCDGTCCTGQFPRHEDIHRE